MIELHKDKKSSTWILTKIDNEGFHHQVNLTTEELNDFVKMWIQHDFYTTHKDR